MTKITLTIRKLALSLAVFATALLPVLYSAPAHAANGHSWVSHSGSDSNSCIDTSPCLTFNGALGKTNASGEISCLDSGSFAAIQITQSVTIDCNGTSATPQYDVASGCPAIIINAPGAVVTLRNLDISGFSLGCSGGAGISIGAAAAVNIENCVIENWLGRGINDGRTAGATQLAIRNTVVRNNGSTGIALAAAAKNSVVIENVQSVGNAYGVAAASGNIVVVRNSVMSENSIAGIFADTGSTVSVDNTMVSHNTTAGIQANGTVVIDNSDIKFNTSSITGATTSYGNNRIFGNGAGTTPTIIAQQ